MEWDQREPCLSPAAFVNQVQYSNILEGRFKQLQGKSQTSLSYKSERGHSIQVMTQKCSFTGLVAAYTFTDVAIDCAVL